MPPCQPDPQAVNCGPDGHLDAGTPPSHCDALAPRPDQLGVEFAHSTSSTTMLRIRVAIFGRQRFDEAVRQREPHDAVEP